LFIDTGILIIAMDGTSTALETELDRTYVLRCTIERDRAMTFHISPAIDRVISLVSNIALLSGLVMGAVGFAGLAA
jgi:hypothetical protein